MVTKGEYTVPSYVDADVQHLISCMLTVQPELRITLPEIKRHPAYAHTHWFKTSASSKQPLLQLGAPSSASNSPTNVKPVATVNMPAISVKKDAFGLPLPGDTVSKRRSSVSSVESKKSTYSNDAAHESHNEFSMEKDTSIGARQLRHAAPQQHDLTVASASVVNLDDEADSDEAIDPAILADLESLGVHRGSKQDLLQRIKSGKHDSTGTGTGSSNSGYSSSATGTGPSSSRRSGSISGVSANSISQIQPIGEQSLERTFYQLLKQRRNSRLEELTKLSPKTTPAQTYRRKHANTISEMDPSSAAYQAQQCFEQQQSISTRPYQPQQSVTVLPQAPQAQSSHYVTAPIEPTRSTSTASSSTSTTGASSRAQAQHSYIRQQTDKVADALSTTVIAEESSSPMSPQSQKAIADDMAQLHKRQTQTPPPPCMSHRDRAISMEATRSTPQQSSRAVVHQYPGPPQYAMEQPQRASSVTHTRPTQSTAVFVPQTSAAAKVVHLLDDHVPQLTAQNKLLEPLTTGSSGASICLISPAHYDSRLETAPLAERQQSLSSNSYRIPSLVQQLSSDSGVSSGNESLFSSTQPMANTLPHLTIMSPLSSSDAPLSSTKSMLPHRQEQNRSSIAEQQRAQSTRHSYQHSCPSSPALASNANVSSRMQSPVANQSSAHATIMMTPIVAASASHRMLTSPPPRQSDHHSRRRSRHRQSFGSPNSVSSMSAHNQPQFNDELIMSGLDAPEPSASTSSQAIYMHPVVLSVPGSDGKTVPLHRNSLCNSDGGTADGMGGFVSPDALHAMTYSPDSLCSLPVGVQQCFTPECSASRQINASLTHSQPRAKPQRQSSDGATPGSAASRSLFGPATSPLTLQPLSSSPDSITVLGEVSSKMHQPTSQTGTATQGSNTDSAGEPVIRPLVWPPVTAVSSSAAPRGSNATLLPMAMEIRQTESPRFHRVRFDAVPAQANAISTDGQPSAEQSTSTVQLPVKKKSWFSSIFGGKTKSNDVYKSNAVNTLASATSGTGEKHALLQPPSQSSKARRSTISVLTGSHFAQAAASRFAAVAGGKKYSAALSTNAASIGSHSSSGASPSTTTPQQQTNAGISLVYSSKSVAHLTVDVRETLHRLGLVVHSSDQSANANSPECVVLQCEYEAPSNLTAANATAPSFRQSQSVSATAGPTLSLTINASPSSNAAVDASHADQSADASPQPPDSAPSHRRVLSNRASNATMQQQSPLPGMGQLPDGSEPSHSQIAHSQPSTARCQSVQPPGHRASSALSLALPLASDARALVSPHTQSSTQAAMSVSSQNCAANPFSNLFAGSHSVNYTAPHSAHVSCDSSARASPRTATLDSSHLYSATPPVSVSAHMSRTPVHFSRQLTLLTSSDQRRGASISGFRSPTPPSCNDAANGGTVARQNGSVMLRLEISPIANTDGATARNNQLQPTASTGTPAAPAMPASCVSISLISGSPLVYSSLMTAIQRQMTCA